MPPIDSQPNPDTDPVGSRLDAAVLLGISPARVAALVREDKLVEPFTFGSLRAYAASKGTGLAKGPKAEGKQYLVTLTADQKAQLESIGVKVVDPRAIAKEREAKQLAAAAKRLGLGKPGQPKA